MIINTEGDFIAPWHLAPKELVKEQGAIEQWTASGFLTDFFSPEDKISPNRHFDHFTVLNT